MGVKSNLQDGACALSREPQVLDQGRNYIWPSPIASTARQIYGTITSQSLKGVTLHRERWSLGIVG